MPEAARPSQVPPSSHAPSLARTLRDPAVRSHRRAMLSAPHMAPLAAYAASLRSAQGVVVPDFDPMDGGIEAQILFLMEKPGPTALQPASFVSRDNDSTTAEATHRFMLDAGLPRADTVIWNAIPWWNGTIRVTAMERTAGLQELHSLLALLPRLHTAVLVGRTAAAARPALNGLRLLESAHPSPQVRAGYRAKWDAIPGVWRQAAVPVATAGVGEPA